MKPPSRPWRGAEGDALGSLQRAGSREPDLSFSQHTRGFIHLQPALFPLLLPVRSGRAQGSHAAITNAGHTGPGLAAPHVPESSTAASSPPTAGLQGQLQSLDLHLALGPRGLADGLVPPFSRSHQVSLMLRQGAGIRHPPGPCYPWLCRVLWVTPRPSQ